VNGAYQLTTGAFSGAEQSQPLLPLVAPGLVPGGQFFSVEKEHVDARDKHAHDENGMIPSSAQSAGALLDRGRTVRSGSHAHQ
jgi:hypothetical protein